MLVRVVFVLDLGPFCEHKPGLGVGDGDIWVFFGFGLVLERQLDDVPEVERVFGGGFKILLTLL